MTFHEGIPPQIMLVEDNPLITEFVEAHLRRAHFDVIAAEGVNEALQLLQRAHPELMVLDVVLDDGLGYDLCRLIRGGGEDGSLAALVDIPILMLTARADQQDRLDGFEAGADDYLTKPFSVDELVYRIRAILRRSVGVSNGLIEIGGLRIDPSTREATVDGHNLELTLKEFDVLHLLASHPGRVYSREDLLQRIWGYTYFGNTRTVDVHINHLRQKLDMYASYGKLITTEWGAGYKLTKPNLAA